MTPFSFFNPIRTSFFIGLLFLCLFFPPQIALAKTPPEIRNQDELVISKDMHGMDLKGKEFVKLDLRGVDFSNADLRGAVFNNSLLQEANFTGADMEDVVAFACVFEGSDLRDANFTNALLMESVFTDASIEGTDFTDAILNRLEKRKLCDRVQGKNTTSALNTFDSLDCRF